MWAAAPILARPSARCTRLTLGATAQSLHCCVVRVLTASASAALHITWGSSRLTMVRISAVRHVAPGIGARARQKAERSKR